MVDSNDTTITVRIPKAVKDDLERRAKRKGQKLSEVVRKALEAMQRKTHRAAK